MFDGITDSYRTEIYVVGPSSAGKTTLCDALAKKLGTDLGPNRVGYITEVARQIMRNSSFTRTDVGRLEMQAAIMEAHLQKEVEARKSLGCHILLSDRSAIDPIVYAVLTASGREEAQQRRRYLASQPQFQHAIRAYKRSTFVLLKPITEWLEDDGIRSLDNQQQCLEIFRQILESFGIRYQEIGPELRKLEERVTAVMGFAQL